MLAIENNKCYLNNTMPGMQTGTDIQTPCGGLSVDFMSRVLVFMGMMLGKLWGTSSLSAQVVARLFKIFRGRALLPVVKRGSKGYSTASGSIR